MATVYTNFRKQAPSELQFDMYHEQTTILRDLYRAHLGWRGRDTILPILDNHYDAFNNASAIVRRFSWVGERYVSILEVQANHLSRLRQSDLTSMVITNLVGLALDYCTMGIVRISNSIGNPLQEPLWIHMVEHVNHLAIMDSFCHDTANFLESSIRNLTTAIDSITTQDTAFIQYISEPRRVNQFFNKLNEFYSRNIKHQKVETKAEHDLHIYYVKQGFEKTGKLRHLNRTLSNSLEAVNAICQKPKNVYGHIVRGDHIGAWIPPWLEMSDAWYEAANEMNQTLISISELT